MSTPFEWAANKLPLFDRFIGTRRRPSLRWAGFAVLLLSLLLPRLAMADYPVTDFAVKCDSAHNRVLIRFVVIDSDDVVKTGSIIHRDLLYTDKSNPAFYTPPLPAALNARWQGIRYRNETGCTLQNGQMITLEQEDGPTGQGMDQGFPDIYFNMKIDNHFAYFHYQFYSGYGPDASGLLLDAVEYAGGKLLLCKAPEEDNKGQVIHGPKCLDESKRLLPGDKHLTTIEQNALVAYRRRQKLKSAVKGAASPFCKSLYAKLDSFTTSKGLVYFFEKKHYLTGGAYAGGLYYSENMISLYNNNVPAHAVEIGYYSSAGTFDDNQNFIFYFGQNRGAYRSFIAFLKKHGAKRLSHLFPKGVDAKAFAPWRKFFTGNGDSWTFSNDGQFDNYWIPRSDVNPFGTPFGTPLVNTIFGYRGTAYVFSMPNNNFGPTPVPASIVWKLMPDKSEKLVCAFLSGVPEDHRF